MEIERLRGRDPGWFATHDHETQVDLLAWHRVFLDPKGER